MSQSKGYRRKQSNAFDYLCVDHFMRSLVDSRVLATAFELNLIDFLQQKGASSVDALAKELQIEDHGLKMLVNLLVTNRVVEKEADGISLTGKFLEALQYRDLMEAKLDFIHFVAHDFIDLFSDLIHNPGKFMQNANILRLFSYDRCFQYTEENFQLTKRWMRITSMLTKYESQACLRYHDFSGYQRMLDVGGNSGEFVLQICRKNPAILATVFDLPLVCEIGLEHIQPQPEADRITFVKGNAVYDNLPTGFDIITFKSILHDWPEEQAKKFILKASKSLAPGGTLLIFERGPFEIEATSLPYSTIPFLLFFRSFRSPTVYQVYLEGLGFRAINIQKIELEMPFYLIVANKA